MPDNDVEKLLADEKSIQERRKQLIEGLLKKREAQNKEIDDQLAQLGYHANHGKAKRSHHKKPSTPTAAATKSKEK